MPIRRYPDTTAPLTTLSTITTDITRPMTANATMNGTNGAMSEASRLSTVSQDSVSVTAPAGSAASSAPSSARTTESDPALRNWYTICAVAGAPGARRAATSPGVTQPSAVFVTDVAMPTTVSAGLRGTLVAVITVPSGSARPLPDSTTWPDWSAQWPACSTMSSTGPPGDARPASVIGGCAPPPTGDRTVASANGPPAAVTCGSR